MAIAVGTNLSGFTLESDNMKAGLVDGSLSLRNNPTSTRTIGDTNEKKCTTGKGSTLTIDMFNQPSGAACPVMALNTTVFSVGGTDYLARLVNLSIEAENMHVPGDGVGDTWEYWQWAGQAIRGGCQLNLSTSVARDILTKVFSTTLTDANVTLAFTLNSVQFSVPLLAEQLTHSLRVGQEQTWDIVFGERGAATLPSGTTTPLERFLNTPSTSETLAMQTKAGTGGIVYGGEYLWKSYKLNIVRREPVKEIYTLISTGAVTEGASS